MGSEGMAGIKATIIKNSSQPYRELPERRLKERKKRDRAERSPCSEAEGASGDLARLFARLRLE